MRPSLKLGDTFYYRYPYTCFFTEVKIVGETKVSWLIRRPSQAPWEGNKKFPKTGTGYIVGTKEEAELGNWTADNGWKISQAVGSCKDGRIMLQIARLLNHMTLQELPKSFRREEDTNEKSGTGTSQS